MDLYHDLKAGERGVWISIIAYISLSALKIIIAHIGNSEGLMADGLNNLTDVIGNITILIGLKIARKPPDENHHYGHFRAETIASLFAAFIMFLVGGKVLYDAAHSVLSSERETPDLSTAWVALIGAMVMFIVFQYNYRLAKKIKSQGLLTASYDNLSDAFVSVGAFVGIIGAQFQLTWLDPLAALIVGLIIIKTAWEIFRETIYFLTDGFDQSRLNQFEQTIKTTKGVLGVKNIRARMLGNRIFVDVTIGVNPNLSIIEAHHITEAIEKNLAKKHQITYVHIHVEPITEFFHRD